MNDLSFKYMVRSYVSNNIPLFSENTELYDDLGKNGINLDQLIVREQLTIPSKTSGSLLKIQNQSEIYRTTEDTL